MRSERESDAESSYTSTKNGFGWSFLRIPIRPRRAPGKDRWREEDVRPLEVIGVEYQRGKEYEKPSEV